MNAGYQYRSQDKSQVAVNSLDKQPAGNKSALQLKDNRPQSAVQKKQVEALTNRQVPETPIQKKVNGTGLPDKLKSGIENLSGHSMDDVKVHYNSAKPAQLNAHAYAQGTEIHVASGQEKHLPHEAWHVVQQKQGRVKPTMQMKGKVNINDDKGLEKEADVMGAKALQGKFFSANGLKNGTRQAFLIQRVGVGEGHGSDNDRGNIITEPVAHNETVSARGDNLGRARITQFLVNGVNRANYTLKHYMVINSGTMFQLPIKYFAAPEEVGVRNVGRHGYHTEYQPNNVPFNDHRDDVRGGQPEAFGGVDDLTHNVAVNDVDLAARRDATLNREYAEENHNHGGAALNITHSKKFAMPNHHGGGMAGTISIARTNAPLNVGPVANNPGPFLNRGKAEMAGTIVINCNDLIDGILVGDALELAIGAKIEAARDAFHQHMGVNAPAMAPFNRQAGIIAHLVGMMKDEIIAQRGIRNMQRIALLLRLDNVSQQHQAREREVAKKKFIVLIIALGLITFLAFFLKMFTEAGSGPKTKDEL